jgi:hypothetical protein
MGNFKDEDKINDLRQRLYSRGGAPQKKEDYSLKSEPRKVPTSWQNPPRAIDVSNLEPVPKRVSEASGNQVIDQAVDSKVVNDGIDEAETFDQATDSDAEEIMPRKNTSRAYRKKIFLAGLGFFGLAIALSSLFFLLGSKSISGDNIAISINGPITIGGGEAIPLQIGVTNQNTVAIESATLIVTYPPDTQSAEEVGKGMTVERLPLDKINPGETLNIPMRAVVFGEENEEKTINAEIEYRVQGSNSTFAKQAEPHRFRIGSSPVVLSVDSIQKISSGQETTIKLKVTSNSTNALKDILVRADYPAGFDYTKADPSPVSNENIWKIDELNPGEETEITITGVVIGKETDEYAVHYSIGVSSDSNKLTLASVFTTATTNFVIEQPFIDVRLALNGDQSGSVAVETGKEIDLKILISNTLEDAIYDSKVVLNISGNAIADYQVDPGQGYYDSINNRISWESAEISNLREIRPGQEVELSLNLLPDANIKVAPQLAFDVDVRARRLTPDRVSEELIGSASGVAKVTSEATLLAEVARGTSVFTETGPLPPVANQATTYTVTFLAESGTNDISGTEITVSLPSYVSWQNQTSGAGVITFNETSRVVTWDAGDIDANQSKIAAFQVSLLPSVTQIGTNPVLINEQRLKATDLFTNEIIRTQKSALTTKFVAEVGYDDSIGEVRASDANNN